MQHQHSTTLVGSFFVLLKPRHLNLWFLPSFGPWFLEQIQIWKLLLVCKIN